MVVVGGSRSQNYHEITRDSLELGTGMGPSYVQPIGGVSCLSISRLRLSQSLPLTEAAAGAEAVDCRLEGQTNALTSDRQGLRCRQGLTDCC